MKPILEFSVVFILAILPQILTLFFINELKENSSRGPNRLKVLNAWVTSGGTILTMLYIASNQSTGFSSIGLSLRRDEIPKVIFASLLVSGYLSLAPLSIRLHSKKRQEEARAQRQQTFETLGFSTYKTVSEKLVSLINLWLAVIAEDLTYRGYLILLLGMRTGTFLPWILLSITLSMIIHLYQGFKWRNAFGHAFLAAVFVITLMTTRNIIAVFIPHLVYDTIWMLQNWANAPKEVTQQPEPVG